MSLDPVKIPANIQIEDKIIGPVSLRQIFILMGCGAIGYVIFSFMKAAGYVSFYSLAAAWSPVAIGAAFAFIKVNDVGLFTLLLLALERMQKPTARAFGPRSGITITISTGKKEEEDEQERKKLAEQKAKQRQSNVHELSEILDQGLPFSPVEQTVDAPGADTVAKAQADANAPQEEEDEDLTMEALAVQVREEQKGKLPVRNGRIEVSPLGEGNAVDTLLPKAMPLESDEQKQYKDTIEPTESIFHDVIPPPKHS